MKIPIQGVQKEKVTEKMFDILGSGKLYLFFLRHFFIWYLMGLHLLGVQLRKVATLLLGNTCRIGTVLEAGIKNYLIFDLADNSSCNSISFHKYFRHSACMQCKTCSSVLVMSQRCATLGHFIKTKEEKFVQLLQFQAG